jgi:small multidrug resistance family-3 protein
MEWTGFARTFGLFFATAIAELVGCFLPLLPLTGKGSILLLLPAAISLVIFV